ncbi:hypothetical protein BGW39_004849 [Mortierella sp. 14UC]|nr:hypothetical protein BGW39_004849 [Mortierella sp. 14UC]
MEMWPPQCNMDDQTMHTSKPTVQDPVYRHQPMQQSSQVLNRHNSAEAASVSPTLSTISALSFLISSLQTKACSPQLPDPSPILPSNYLLTATSLPTQLTGSHRRRLTPDETEYLLRQYHANEKPATKDRLTFAAHLNLHPRTIQVWFQNRRAKLRREIALVEANDNDTADDDDDSSSSDIEPAHKIPVQENNAKIFPEGFCTSSNTHGRVEAGRANPCLAWNRGAHCSQDNPLQSWCPDGLSTAYRIAVFDQHQQKSWSEGDQALSVGRGSGSLKPSSQGSKDDKPIFAQTVSKEPKTFRPYERQARQPRLRRPGQGHPTCGYHGRLKGHAKGPQSLIPRQQRALTLVRADAHV